MRVSFPIVFVSNMEGSVRFYRDIVGLPLKFQSPHWSEFESEGTRLALHGSDGPSDAGRGGSTKAPGTCRPGFGVKNLAEFHERMLAHQVACTQEPHEVFGAQIAQYLDPDGMEFGVSQDQ